MDKLVLYTKQRILAKKIINYFLKNLIYSTYEKSDYSKKYFSSNYTFMRRVLVSVICCYSYMILRLEKYDVHF